MSDVPDYSRQPPPRRVEGAVSVLDLVAADLRNLWKPGPALDAVLEAVAARKEYGLAKYGTVLQAGNGRDFLADVDDEAVDLAAYMRGLIVQDPEYAQQHDLLNSYREILIIMTKVRALLADRRALEMQS